MASSMANVARSVGSYPSTPWRTRCNKRGRFFQYQISFFVELKFLFLMLRSG